VRYPFTGARRARAKMKKPQNTVLRILCRGGHATPSLLFLFCDRYKHYFVTSVPSVHVFFCVCGNRFLFIFYFFL